MNSTAACCLTGAELRVDDGVKDERVTLSLVGNDRASRNNGISCAGRLHVRENGD